MKQSIISFTSLSFSRHSLHFGTQFLQVRVDYKVDAILILITVPLLSII